MDMLPDSAFSRSESAVTSAWVVDYSDQNGKRRNETFAAKGLAVARHVQVALNARIREST